MVTPITSVIIHESPRCVTVPLPPTITGGFIGSTGVPSTRRECCQIIARESIPCMPFSRLLASTVTPEMRSTELVAVLLKLTPVKKEAVVGR